MQDRAKRIRQAVGLTQMQAAVLARVSQTTWRIFEREPNALRKSTRQRCDAAMLTMAKSLGEGRQ